MAPVEADYVPASIVPVKNLRVVDKAMELPLVNSAYSEVTRITCPITPYVETTLTKVSPMMEAGYQTFKSQVEEKLVPHIPSNLSESVSKNINSTLESVSAAVEKADSYACSGIDQLTEKVPQLKDARPKLLKETKENVSSYITAATDYTASFSLAQVALKVVDAGLTAVEGILNKVGHGEESLVVSGVRKLHNTANTIRLSGLKKAGTEKAKKIEEGTILEAIIFLFGVSELMESLGLKPSKNEPETEEPVVSDTAVTDEVQKPLVSDMPVNEEVEKPVATAFTEEVEEPVESDMPVTEEVEEPVEFDMPVTEEVEEPVVVDTAVTEEVEEAVEVDTAYSRTLRNRKVENVVEDSE